MAEFTVFAEVLTPADPKVQAYHAGVFKSHPGMLLRDVLKRTDANWYTTAFLPPRLREDIRRVAELSNDNHLLEISKQDELRVSIEHLKDMDPDKTWVAVGTRLMYTPEEAEKLKDPKRTYDPRKSFLVG